MRVAILTISDAGTRGARVDTSGETIASWVRARGYDLADRMLVPDETDQIVNALCGWCDSNAADLILTTGGTGLSARDVTPEATRAVIDREAPGIAERIRIESIASFPRAALSRGVSGVRTKTLIINLPGSTSGVRDGLASIDPIIDHAIAVLRGDRFEHADEPSKPSSESLSGDSATRTPAPPK